MKQELTDEIVAAYDAFIRALDKFSNEEFNVSPFAGSWTPGQVADHIFKSTKGIPDRNTTASNRQHDEKIPLIENGFLNFEVKMKSPDFVYPDAGPFNKKEMIEKLNSVKEKHKVRIAERDLTAMCVEFELPRIGQATRYEWFKFIIAHVKRHTHQLNNMMPQAQS
jgi:hypothetical protein